MKTQAPDISQARFVSELLVTDTIVYEVVGRTAKTVKLRTTRRGEVLKRENRDGNPYPCTWTEELPDPDARVRTCRLRKDGTYRMHYSGNPIRPATMIDGKPASYTDYRM